METAIRAMHCYEQPMVWLSQSAEFLDGDFLRLTGGTNLYHVLVGVAYDGWFQAINLDGSSESVIVQTSGQGYVVEKRFTWTLEQTLEIAHWYVEHGRVHPQHE